MLPPPPPPGSGPRSGRQRRASLLLLAAVLLCGVPAGASLPGKLTAPHRTAPSLSNVPGLSGCSVTVNGGHLYRVSFFFNLLFFGARLVAGVLRLGHPGSSGQVEQEGELTLTLTLRENGEQGKDW